MSDAYKEQPHPFEKRREERSVVVEEWKQREALRESRIAAEAPPRAKSWGTSELELERWKIEFSIGKAMRYHAYRRAFWDRIAQRTKIVVLFGAAVTLAALIGEKSSFWSETAAVIVVLLATLDVAFDFAGRARSHHDRFRNLCSLAKEIAEQPRPTDMEIGRWRAQCIELEISQPGAIGWLDKRCAAEEAIAREIEPKSAWLLPGWKLMLSQWAFWST